jgi:hypothetical protein
MGLLAWILRSSGLTQGWLPCSAVPSLLDLVPMVPNNISSLRVLGKRASVLKIQTLLFLVKLSSAPILSEIIC